MRTAQGFTLIELLVVISITAILGVLTIANFKDFSRTQILNKAASDIQNFLIQAQSNATTSTLCDGQGGASWGVNFRPNIDPNSSTIDLVCSANTIIKKTLTLENVTISSIRGSSCVTSLNVPLLVSYSPLYGKLSFWGFANCLNSSSTVTINLTYTKTGDQKSFNITQGGVSNVQ